MFLGSILFGLCLVLQVETLLPIIQHQECQGLLPVGNLSVSRFENGLPIRLLIMRDMTRISILAHTTAGLVLSYLPIRSHQEIVSISWVLVLHQLVRMGQLYSHYTTMLATWCYSSKPRPMEGTHLVSQTPHYPSAHHMKLRGLMMVRTMSMIGS
jgi:hypothetical protein